MNSQFNKLDKDVKHRIISAANTIRKKYLAWKLERGEEDEALNKYLKPITDPLNILVENSAKKSRKRKIMPEMAATSVASIVKQQPKSEVAFLPAEKEEKYGDTSDDENDSDIDDVFENKSPEFQQDLETSIRENPEGFAKFLEQYSEIARSYMKKFWTHSKDLDSAGVRFDVATNSWNMGSKNVEFLSNGDIKIAQVTYPGTKGLYDLIFLKNPIYNTKADNAQYKDILKRTGCYQTESGRLKGSKSHKYKTIIRPLLGESSRIPPIRGEPSRIPPIRPRTKSVPDKIGRTLIQYSETPKEYVYYEDVNDLVERFKKLHASKQVGNNNNMGEISSILRELERLGVIEFYK